MQREVTRGSLTEGLKLNPRPIGLQPTMPPYYQSCLFSDEIMIPVYPCKFHYFQPLMLHPTSLYKAPVFTLSLFHTKPREKKHTLVFSSCVNQFSFLLGINKPFSLNFLYVRSVDDNLVPVPSYLSCSLISVCVFN